MNVYYFMISTTLISLKLFVAWWVGFRSKPGYVERDQLSVDADGRQHEPLVFSDVLKKLPGEKLCPECKVIKPPRSRHCQACNKCTDRYETHCVWLNNCVGRGNSNYHMIFVFYVWLDVFLLGWISMSMIGVTHCDTMGSENSDGWQGPQSAAHVAQVSFRLQKPSPQWQVVLQATTSTNGSAQPPGRVSMT